MGITRFVAPSATTNSGTQARSSGRLEVEDLRRGSGRQETLKQNIMMQCFALWQQQCLQKGRYIQDAETIGVERAEWALMRLAC